MNGFVKKLLIAAAIVFLPGSPDQMNLKVAIVALVVCFGVILLLARLGSLRLDACGMRPHLGIQLLHRELVLVMKAALLVEVVLRLCLPFFELDLSGT